MNDENIFNPDVALSAKTIVEIFKRNKLGNRKLLVCVDKAWTNCNETPMLVSQNDEVCFINTDVSSGSGEHWVAIFKFENTTIFFDSYGRSPKEFKPSHIHDIDAVHYPFCYQARGTYVCGHYILYILWSIDHGYQPNFIRELKDNKSHGRQYRQQVYQGTDDWSKVIVPIKRSGKALPSQSHLQRNDSHLLQWCKVVLGLDPVTQSFTEVSNKSHFNSP